MEAKQFVKVPPTKILHIFWFLGDREIGILKVYFYHQIVSPEEILYLFQTFHFQTRKRYKSIQIFKFMMGRNRPSFFGLREMFLICINWSFNHWTFATAPFLKKFWRTAPPSDIFHAGGSECIFGVAFLRNESLNSSQSEGFLCHFSILAKLR